MKNPIRQILPILLLLGIVPSLAMAEEGIVEIKEKMFLTQINDIYYNYDDYKDKKIVVEGMFALFESADGKSRSPVVFRYGPGCCSNDGWGGFLLDYKDNQPATKDWIRVVGTPEIRDSTLGLPELYLKVETLEVKTKRGLELVKQ